MSDKTKCLNPNCAADASARGLCVSCYRVARKLVKNGHATWEQLECAGKCKPSHNGLYGKTQRWLLSQSYQARPAAEELAPRLIDPNPNGK